VILSAHQPQFMPWTGYFDKMRSCGVFVLLDDVQFKKNEWQNRNRILTPQGPQWLTVPVIHESGAWISRVRINNSSDWKRKHLKTLVQNYGNTDYFARIMAEVEKIYSQDFEYLSRINTASVLSLAGMLGVKTRTEMLSANPVEGAASMRLVNLCRKFGADTYLAGAGGKEYMDMKLFSDAGIKVEFQNYAPPAYRQSGGEFVPGLSALDLLFHSGGSLP